MDLDIAAAKADAILNLIIANQPTFVPSGATASADRAEQFAKNVATFRQALVQELAKQKD